MNDAELLRLWMDKQDGGLTQAQAAEWLGIKQPAIHAVLSGKSALSGSGRKFVEHLLNDLDNPTPEKAALLKIWQLSAGALPPEYRDNSYLFSDVG